MLTTLAATDGRPPWDTLLLQDKLITVAKHGKASQQRKSKLEALLGYGKTSYKKQHKYALRQSSTVPINLIEAPCIFVESLQRINQQMHI